MVTQHSWSTPRTEAERLDASLLRFSRICLWLGIGAVFFIAFYGMWVQTHPEPTYLDVVRECEAQKNGVAKVERNAKGEVIGVLCNHPAVWRL